MARKVPVKIDQLYLHEVLDRASMLSSMIDTYLSDHPVMKKLLNTGRKISRAAEMTTEAYSEIGKIAFADVVKNKRKK